MKDFALLFRGGLNFQTATEEQIKDAMERWKVWMSELVSSGRSTGGQRLTDKGTVISGSKKQVTDGPYVEGKEMVGGVLDLKARDFEEAVEIANSCPIFHFNGIVEVREVAPRSI
jgi:hypothetical protein